MPVRLEKLAEIVGGTLTGDGNVEIRGAATLRDAGPGEITLADDEKYSDKLMDCRATAAVVPPGIQPEGISFITVDNAREAFAAIVTAFCPTRPRKAAGISPRAIVSSTAQIADGVTISAGCVIGDDVQIGAGSVVHPNVTILDGARIGDKVVLFPGVVIYENSIVGNRVTIHAAAVIGAYGFGYEQVDGCHVRTPQLGNVVLEDDVEIGAGTTIDRGTYSATRVGSGTKIDNQVMIGHNCSIGKNNLICAHVGIAGSSSTGDNVVMAGQVGVRDHVDIADNIMIGAQSGVSESLNEAGKYLGSPAIPLRQEIQTLMARSRLTELRKQVRRVERTLDSLTAATPTSTE